MKSVPAIVLAALMAGAITLWGVTPAEADPADELINELRCPAATYTQPLATSTAPEATWMRAFIREKVAEGWPRQRIVGTLVRQYGEGILATPAKEGFGLAAWLTPFATILGGATLLGYLLVAWLGERKWRDAYLSAELARGIDESDLQRYEAQISRDLEQFE